MPKILVIVSSARSIRLKNGKEHPTGYFLGELAEPLRALGEAGFEFEFATPGGLEPAMDQDSLRYLYWIWKGGERNTSLTYLRGLDSLKKPLVLEHLTGHQLEGYQAMMIPGGHAPMVDLAESDALAEILTFFHEAGKPIGLICHAPAALLSLKKSAPWPFAGYRMTVFSTLEEKFAEFSFLHGGVPYYLEDALAVRGAQIHNTVAPPRGHVVRDRELVTGQNPFSPRAFVKAMIDALREYQARGSLRKGEGTRE